MARLTPWPTGQELDGNGDPLAGGRVDVFEAGTTTRVTTYTDESEDTPNTNPVVLNSEGRAQIWLADGGHKLRLFDAAGNLIDERDDVVADSAGESVSIDVTTNTNVNSTFANSRIYANGSLTLSLLPVGDAGDGFEFIVRNTGANDVVILPDSTEQINGAATLTVDAGQSVRVMCDGDEWHTFGSNLSLGGLAFLSVAPLVNGGTGAITAPNARTNLEVYSRAEVDTTIAAVNAAIAAITPTTFASPAQAVNFGSIVTLPHGLGARPVKYRAVIVCTAADQGYAVGDSIDVTKSGGEDTLAPGFSSNMVADVANVSYVFGIAGMLVPHKATFGTAAITAASWELYLTAEL